MEGRTTVELDGQYRAMREEVAMVERAGRRIVSVGGAEAADYLQGQLTNDVEALAPGRGCYAALLDRKGHMQSDMRVLRLAEDAFRLDLEPVAAEQVIKHLGMYKIGREVVVEDVSERWALLALIGPAAAEASGVGPLAPEHTHRAVDVGGAACHAVASDAGLDLLIPAGEAGAVREALAAAGVAAASEEAAEILRVESGRPRFGHEMTSATIPDEAGINERAVSFTKGCYIGQETVARLHYKGRPNRHLRGLRLGGAAAAGDPVRLGEREVGSVGTAVISPAHGPIALAILRREAAPGATVSVGDGVEAEVVTLPF